MGVRLLSRTTRSVAHQAQPGEHLLARLRPAFADIREALGQVSGLRNKPAGRVRLLLPRLATNTVLAPKLGEFVRAYPDIVLDVTTDDSRMDIVAEGFDAGIHFGEYIRERHDRGACVSGRQTNDSELARLSQIPREAEIAS